MSRAGRRPPLPRGRAAGGFCAVNPAMAPRGYPVARTTPPRELLGVELSPGREVAGDTGPATAVRRTVSGYQHTAGTCRMDPASDPTVVVSPAGAVHGAPGLSVVDASALPALPVAHTNLTVMAVAGHRARRPPWAAAGAARDGGVGGRR